MKGGASACFTSAILPRFARRYVYVWADGIDLQGRMEDEKPCILVVIGATPEGRKDLVGVQAGFRESTQNWRELLNDLKGRGLSNGPDLAVGDGALGFWTAIDDVFPGARHQRCWVHNTANVLNKVPKSKQKAAKDDLHAIWMAEGRAEAEKGDGHLQSQVATCSSASRHCAR